METVNKRLAWLDVAKGLTMLAVIVGHTAGGSTLTHDIIYSFHMPLFFLLSGYTMKPAKDVKTWCRNTRKDFIRLILPIIGFELLNGVLSILLDGSDFMTEWGIFRHRLFWASAFWPRETPNIGALWFLAALFAARLFLNLFSVLFGDNFELLGFLAGYAGMILWQREIRLPLGLVPAMVSTLFVAGGAAARRCRAELSRHRTPLFVIATLLVFSMLGQNINIDIAVGRCTPEMLVKVLASSFSVCVICRILSSQRILAGLLGLIGRHTMPILLVHNVDDWFLGLYYCENSWVRMAAARIFWVLLFAGILEGVYRLLCRKKER